MCMSMSLCKWKSDKSSRTLSDKRDSFETQWSCAINTMITSLATKIGYCVVYVAVDEGLTGKKGVVIGMKMCSDGGGWLLGDGF